MLNLLSELKQEKKLSESDYQFARFIASKQPADYPKNKQNLAILLSALISFYSRQGNSCLNLDTDKAKFPFGLRPIKDKTLENKRCFYDDILQKIDEKKPLDPSKWQDILKDHIAFSQDPNQVAPMLFQNNRLYFYRYWQAENRIATKMKQMVQSDNQGDDTALNKQILDRLFTQNDNNEINWQKVAVATALTKKFCLISGGPGTGKTWTVAKLLTALQLKQLEKGESPLNIALAAPTGKAAARLKESLAKEMQGEAEEIRRLVPEKASTIHSLLGIRPNQDLPKYNANNPLHYDLLLVDEASMLDLFVMEKTFNALKPNARLILLGDKDQLASVEAGNTMGELGGFIEKSIEVSNTMGKPVGFEKSYSERHCAYLQAVTGYNIFPKNNKLATICDSLTYLEHSRRFDGDSGIGNLATAVNQKQADTSWKIFAKYGDLALHPYPEKTDKFAWSQECVAEVVNKAVELYQDYLSLVKARQKNPQAVAVHEIFTAFAKVRFLTALRVSELGVENLNQRIAESLKNQKWVYFHHSRENYLGKPILITENNPQLGIYSGDIGLVLPDENGKPRIYFETKAGDEHLNLSPSRLPSCEPAYVMTVHKSQGSEFQHTVLVMPLTPSPVLTKELIYTAITRARKQFTLFGTESVWKSGVTKAIQRQSGLRELLE